MQFRVTADTALRDAPNRSANVVARLATGTVVERSGKNNRRWVPVLHGATSGWVAERHVEKIGEPGPNGGQPTTEDEIIAIIREAARAFDQPQEDLVRVGRCESNLDPRAINPD